jgi:hypothetical protein
MLRKTIIALVAAASVGMLAPNIALARGGGGGGGGGHGGGGFGGGGGLPGGGLVEAASTAAALGGKAVSTPVVWRHGPLLALADFTAERWRVAIMAVASTTGLTVTTAAFVDLEGSASTPMTLRLRRFYYDMRLLRCSGAGIAPGSAFARFMVCRDPAPSARRKEVGPVEDRDSRENLHTATVEPCPKNKAAGAV